MAKLKWDEEKQAFEYRVVATRFGGSVFYLTMEELPAGVKVESRNGEPISVEVDDAYLKTKLPNLKKPNDLKEAANATEFLTVEELTAKREQALSGVADTSPFGDKPTINIQSAQEIANSDNYSRTPNGVGYIAPDALPGTEPSMVVIKPKKQYLGSTFSETVDVITAEEGLAEILNQARQTPGGISALKQKLVSSGFYGGELTALAPYSLSVKDMEDDYFVTALASALRSQSILNYGYAKQGRALLDFDSWLKESEAAYSSILSDKTVNLPNPKDARQVFIENYQRYVGATPDDNTIAAFVASANAYANANPDIITPVVQTGARVVQPGFNAQQLDEFAQEYILQTPQAQEYGMEQGGIDMFSGAIDGLLNELQTSISQNRNVGLQ